MAIRPQYHFTPKKNWINDPNGLCFHNGRYHLYYQYNPFGVCWGCMHWGHASSTNLLDWEDHPIALAYDNEFDKDGCFSGSAIEKDGLLHIMYTGVKYHNVKLNEHNIPVQADPNGFTPAQIHAVSKDGGLTFEKTLPPAIPVDKHAHPVHVRDPKVWKTKEGFYRLVLGNTENQRQGSLLFYRSDDLISWTYEGKWTSPDFGWGWECPDFFELDGYDVLIFSPMGAGPEECSNLSLYLIGHMDWETFDFRWEKKGFVDECFDIYAPQSFLHENRRIMIGWLRMLTPFPNDDFCGMMTLARELSVREGFLCSYPVAELEQKRVSLYQKKETTHSITTKSACYDLETEFSGDKPFSCQLSGAKNETLKVDYNEKTSVLTIDRSGVLNGYQGMVGANSIRIPLPRKQSHQLRIVMDHSVAEFFVDKGLRTCSCIINPSQELATVKVEFTAPTPCTVWGLTP
ncbi:MAG: glycoside hydrolase family 32 protein [Brevinema sp.]